jgi:hypothetical protein
MHSLSMSSVLRHPDRIEISFDWNENLHIRVRMLGEQRVFNSGKLGHSFRDHFE